MGKGTTKETVVTQIDSLHQMDVPGDGTGLFQAGLPFMSLHHLWHGWTDAFGESQNLQLFSPSKLFDFHSTSRSPLDVVFVQLGIIQPGFIMMIMI